MRRAMWHVGKILAGLLAYVAYWTEYSNTDRWVLEHVGWEALPTITEALHTLCAVA